MGVVRSVGLRLASLRPLDRRRLALVGVFLGTRLLMVVLAGNPPLYTLRAGGYLRRLPLTGEWGSQIAAFGGMPYSEVPIEYPPGMLPFVLAPTWLLHQLKVPLLLNFILLMLVVDGLGLTGLRRLGRQWGSDLGAWLWVVALPLLGPIVLLGWTLCRRLPRSGAWNAPRPAGGGQRGRSWALDAWQALSRACCCQRRSSSHRSGDASRRRRW